VASAGSTGAYPIREPYTGATARECRPGSPIAIDPDEATAPGQYDLPTLRRLVEDLRSKPEV